MKNLLNKISKLYFLILIIAVASFYIVIEKYFSEFDSLTNSRSDWGTFGDFVGGILNPTFSFLGLIALLITIHLQKKEIDRNSLSQEISEIIQKKQIETQIKQQFEGTFFSLLEMHNKALDRLTEPNINLTGNISSLESLTNFALADDVNYAFKARERLEVKDNICGSYFRILYHTLKFISTNFPKSENQSIDQKNKFIDNALEKKRYSSIVRSFLGYEIIQLLAIHCYCENESDPHWNYKSLVEEFEFFEHMPFKKNDNYHAALLETIGKYNEKAFGKSDFLPAAKAYLKSRQDGDYINSN